jgi:hypothetical protein
MNPSGSDSQNDIIELNVGGTRMIATTRSTLTKFPSSTLGWMFSGKHELKNHEERIFIDRDGDAFIAVLSYLRTGIFPLFGSKLDEEHFLEEMEYWQIPLEHDSLPSEVLDVQCFDT